MANGLERTAVMCLALRWLVIHGMLSVRRRRNVPEARPTSGDRPLIEALKANDQPADHRRRQIRRHPPSRRLDGLW